MFQINETKLMEMGMCSYRITIKTSCNSPKYTKDTIGILFGDAYGKEVLYFIFKKYNLFIFNFI